VLQSESIEQGRSPNRRHQADNQQGKFHLEEQSNQKFHWQLICQELDRGWKVHQLPSYSVPRRLPASSAPENIVKMLLLLVKQAWRTHRSPANPPDLVSIEQSFGSTKEEANKTDAAVVKKPKAKKKTTTEEANKTDAVEATKPKAKKKPATNGQCGARMLTFGAKQDCPHVVIVVLIS
jgi:hypothetical protein